MTNQQFQALIQKVLDGEASMEERSLVNTYLERLGIEDPGIYSHEDVENITASVLERVHAEMLADDEEGQRERLVGYGQGLEAGNRILPMGRRILRYAAVVLVLVLGAGLYVRYTNRQRSGQVVKNVQTPPVNDALPGSNKAVLVLANGSHITLDQDENRMIKEENGQQIANVDGALSYADAAGGGKTNGKAIGSEVFYNTVRVPRKGQYKLVLADGTKVWLNAESSLRYPTAFDGAERKVEITGEAYFEVAKNVEKPFHVIHDKMDVEVLGTHFNINSYDDEQQGRISLLEGAVNVSSSLSNTAVRLAPGQQARLKSDGKLTVVDNADMEEAIAWKEGRFQFRAASMESIMRQLTRWYDVEVEYRGDFSHRHFTADISRSKNLSSVIKILELSNITCTIEDHKLIVTP